MSLNSSEFYYLLNQEQKNFSLIGNSAAPKALIVILFGQSLNWPRNTTVQATAPSSGYRMAVKAASTAYFSFAATNAEWATNWDDVATDAEFTEGALQTPLAGITNSLDADGTYSKVWLASAAIGARTIQVLGASEPRANIHALLKRYVAFAVADGFTTADIDIAFYSAHGEANANAGTTETDYYNLGILTYKQLQLMAAQALGDPTYVAPVFLDYPLQNSTIGNTGINDRIIKEAIRRIAIDLPGGVDIGPKYQWGGENDRVHAPAEAIVLRGEFVGKAIPEYFNTGVIENIPPQIISVTLSGTTAVVTFDRNIVRDATLGVGQNLNTANAEDGFEWFDNGAVIAINSISYGSNTATLTLNSTPSGTLEQQVCRIAVQTTTNSLISGIGNLSGCLVRADTAGWPSIYDPTYTNYAWAIPQTFDGVTAP